MKNKDLKDTNGRIPSTDWAVTIPSLIIICLLCTLFLLLDMRDSSLLNRVFAGTTNHLGGFFHIYIAAVLVLLLYISFSKIGSIRLGDGPPEHSRASWFSMLFCACIGSSIMYWGLIEWAYYVIAPPFGYGPMSRAALEASVGYTMFHWGISGWATYSIAAVIIAFYYFVKKIPNLRISVSCGFTKETGKETLGNIVDIFVIVGLCAGVAVSIALGTPMITEGLHSIAGISTGLPVKIGITVLWSCLFGTSAIFGIDKGIKTLSNINSIIALGFIVFVFLAGASSFIFNNAVNSLGFMFQNYLFMSFSTDPIGKSGFPQDWTIFYWAWWFSYVPVMGLFIAKISKGRTIREVALGGTLLGSLGCWLFLTVLGGFGLEKQIAGIVDTAKNLQAAGDYAAIMSLLGTLPFSKIVISVFVIVAFIFLATTCDSSAYILASISTRNISGYAEPQRRIRLLWVIMIIVWPIILLIVGGLNVVKLCSVLGSLPILVILAFMIRNFMKDTRKISANL
jgi:BCCT family betaine/carnitine transporter